jgi:hypothetical protein
VGDESIRQLVALVVDHVNVAGNSSDQTADAFALKLTVGGVG